MSLKLKYSHTQNKVSTTVFQKGFTIVELLIVIVVIGILATIVIVAYNGIQARAKDAAVKSDIDNFKRAIELAKVDNNDQYPSTLTAAMGIKVSKSNYTLNSNNWYYCTDTNGTRYAVGVAIDDARNGYVYDTVTGLTKINGSLWGGTTCPAATYTAGVRVGCAIGASAPCVWQPWTN